MNGRATYPSQRLTLVEATGDVRAAIVRNRFRSHVAIALLVCALILRIIVPAGWMPVTGSDGIVRLALCSGVAAQTMSVHATGKMHHDAPPASKHDPQPCAFSELAFAADIGESFPVPAPAFIEHKHIAIMGLVSIGRGLAAPPPPSTGPPSLT